MLKFFLRSFIPWIIFFILFVYDQTHLQIGAIGALIALLILSRKSLARGFLFDWGSLLFFIFVCSTIFMFYESWVKTNADLLANAALSIIAWLSLILKRPFTLEYARQSVAKEYWQTPLFIRTNRYLTIAWASAFTIITVCSFIQQFTAEKSVWITDILPVICLITTIGLSVWFPRWYTQRELGAGGIINLEGLSDLHFVETSSAILSYRVLGHGSPIILLPGINMSMYGWDPVLVATLGSSYRVILLDYPGIGESRAKVNHLNISIVTKIINEFIAALNIDSVILLGYAMGGYFAQRLTIDYNQHVRGLVLIATDAGGRRASHPEPQLLAHLISTEGTLEQQQQQLMDILFPASAIPVMQSKIHDLFRIAGLVRSVPGGAVLAEKDLLDEWYAASGGSYNSLSEITQPALIMMGILDRIVHRQNGIVLANGMKNAKLIEFPDAGHGLIYQHPEQIADEIIKFFKTTNTTKYE